MKAPELTEELRQSFKARIQSAQAVAASSLNGRKPHTGLPFEAMLEEEMYLVYREAYEKGREDGYILLSRHISGMYK